MLVSHAKARKLRHPGGCDLADALHLSETVASPHARSRRISGVAPREKDVSDKRVHPLLGPDENILCWRASQDQYCKTLTSKASHFVPLFATVRPEEIPNGM